MPHDRVRVLEDENARLAGELADVEARYRELIEQIPAVTYVAAFEADGKLLYVSPQVEELLGHSAQAFLDDAGLWDRLLHPADRERVIAETARVHRHAVDFECEFRMLAADGREVTVWERDAIVFDDAGRPAYTQGVLVDITSLRRAERDARSARDRAQRYLDLTTTVILALAPDGTIALLNRAGHELLGYDDGELVDGDWFALCVEAADRDRLRGEFVSLLENGCPPGTHGVANVRTRDGSVRVVEWRPTLVRDEDGVVTTMLSSGVDVTERQTAEQQIAHLAYHDGLTGLPNRALLDEHLEIALARARRSGDAIALLYLDLDDFKLVNDSFGHAGGDEVVRQAAERLTHRVRAADLLGRIGGDEFALLVTDLEDDPVTAAQRAADGLQGAFAEPFCISGEDFHLGASIGISVFPRDASDADTLMRHADAAMYTAKAAGRGAISAYEARRAAPRQRLALMTRLRRAIGDGELRLHWQPIVDPADGVLHAVEALVRWEDPRRGLLLPGEFVPDAEESGLIEDLGGWVLSAVCEQRLRWREQGLAPHVHVNVSPRELRRGDYAERLLSHLEAHALPASGLTVELTETAVMRERARSEPLLRALDAAGVRVAIDDFGAGYSSLTRLRELPVQTLKLDRAFMANVPRSRAAAAVVTAVLELAAAVDMRAVAEGVETDDQRAFLVERGCRLAQGFRLGRPVAAELLATQLHRDAGVAAPLRAVR